MSVLIGKEGGGGVKTFLDENETQGRFSSFFYLSVIETNKHNIKYRLMNYTLQFHRKLWQKVNSHAESFFHYLLLKIKILLDRNYMGEYDRFEQSYFISNLATFDTSD